MKRWQRTNHSKLPRHSYSPSHNMFSTSWLQKWKDLRNGSTSRTMESEEVGPSQNAENCKPAPSTTSRLRTSPEARSDQEIIQNHPWTLYTSVSPREKEATELSVLLEVARTSNQSLGDVAIAQKLCSELLRNNLQFKEVFLRCWKMGSFQDVRSDGGSDQSSKIRMGALSGRRCVSFNPNT